MFGTGLRVSEALALRPSDLDLAAGTVRVRDIPLPVAPATSAPLARWLDLRAGLGLNGRQPLFCTISAGEVREKGQPLSSSYVRALLPRLAARAGIDRRVHPNALRHSHAFYVTAEAVKVAQR